MSYSIDSLTEDCYAGSSVLINKFDIQDQRILDDVEAVIVTAQQEKWLAYPLANSFDFGHYKDIHKYLFDDLYAWAGKIRTVNISKKRTNFCPCDDITDRADALFARLKGLNYLKCLDDGIFVEELVDFYIQTNYLHPFREGNGRTQRVFITQLVRNAGREIDFSQMDKDLLMIATIQAADGVRDNLRELFKGQII